MSAAWSKFRWDDEAVARLKVLYFDGKSASQIGAELGCGRNAVIGKVHRLGLPLRGGNGASKSQMSRKVARDAQAKRRVKTATGQNIPPRAPGMGWVRLDPSKSVTLPVPPDDAVPEHAVSLIDLEPHHCRWVHGDTKGHHGYCGKPKVPGLSYCDGHAAKAYRAPATKSERDEAMEKYREKAREMA